MMSIALVMIGVVLGTLAMSTLQHRIHRVRRDLRSRLEDELEAMKRECRLRVLTEDLRYETQPHRHNRSLTEGLDHGPR